jgi:hypothetical protein
MRTLKEIYGSLLALLPPGLVGNMGPDRRKIWEAIADVIRTEVSDRLDAFITETNPARASYFLPLWESALDLSSTKIATFGTIAQRRAQVVSALRGVGDLSLPGLRALLALFLDYADPGQIQILEADRDTIKTLHTYPAVETLPLTIPTGFPPLDVKFQVPDDGPVSDAGAQVLINITGDLSELTFTLSGPGGTGQQVFFDVEYLGSGPVVAQDFVLYAPPAKRTITGASVRGQTLGTWHLTCTSRAGTGTLHAAGLFVEALGRNSLGQESLGNELHYFAVIVDPGLVGPNYDLEGATDAARKHKPSYAGVAMVVKGAPLGPIAGWPDLPTTIPDDTLPG